MSETITRRFRAAALPHEPIEGPISRGVMASIQPLGTRGPAAGQRRMPSASISITAEMELPAWASTVLHKSCKTSVSPAPREINSRVRVSADKSDSRWANLEARPASFSFGPLEAGGVGSRLEDDAGALMNSLAVVLGLRNILKILSDTAGCHLRWQLPGSDGSAVMDRRYALCSQSHTGPVPLL